MLKYVSSSKTLEITSGSGIVLQFFEAIHIRIYIQRCCSHVVVTSDVKWWNTISAVTWRTVHEHTEVDAFCSEGISSALLFHEQQAPQK